LIVRKIHFLAAALAIAGAAETHASPCAGFVDVDDTSGPTAGFCADVTWIRNRNVTLGCTATQYCPFQNVSRIQMAAFMRRLGEALFPITCATGQFMKWNGVAWACSNDNAGGTGSVTSVAAGTGLQGSPITITGAGTVSLASSYRLPQACTNGQVAKSNGAGVWTCAAEANAGGTVTSIASGTGLTGGPVTTSGTLAVNTTTIQVRVTGACSAGSAIRAVNVDGSVACETDDNAGPNAFVQGGNAFSAPAILGTTDFRSFEIRAGGVAMRYEPNGISPNIIGGSTYNDVGAGVRGATIRGGGTQLGFFNPDPFFTDEGPNVVYGSYGTIGGGLANTVGYDATADPQTEAFGTVGGGRANHATADSSVSGGWNNSSRLFGTLIDAGELSTIGGGVGNRTNFLHNAIGGGRNNTMQNVSGAVIVGGIDNRAKHVLVPQPTMAIAGGIGNVADVQSVAFNNEGPMIIGGRQNGAYGHYAIAAGAFAVAEVLECVVFSLWSNSSLGQSCLVPPTYDPNPALGSARRLRIGATNGFSVDYFAQRTDGGGERWVAIGAPIFPDNTITAWNGARLSNAGDWLIGSDRNGKENFEPVDDRLFEAVIALPIIQWFYRVEGPGVQHIGPVAQDFRAAFNLGYDDKTIATVDAAGVTLAAVQGMHARIRTREAELAGLHRVADELLARLGPVEEDESAPMRH
jgi:hypothetical protein